MIPVASFPSFRPPSGEGVPGCFFANARPDQDVVVAIHGISRNAAEMATRFAAHPAFARTTIIAPLFTPKPFGRYQQMRARRRGETPSDKALIALLEAIATDYGIATDKVRLFGFSGGAQMAHRFAMFYPERVTRLCVASAGWYCLPRTDLAYPYGIGGTAGETLVGPQFLDIPTTVIVGNRDVRIDDSVRQDAVIVAHQGKNRLRRAHGFVKAMAAYAHEQGRPTNVRLLTLPDVSHDFTACVSHGGLIDAAAKALV